MARDQPADDEGLASGPEEAVAVGLAIALQRPDLGDHARAAHQQVVQMGVDLVDLSAQIVNRGVGGRHDWGRWI
jgi:hypothetical protein